MVVASTSGPLVPEALLKSHEEPPPLENHDHDQEEQGRHANLLLWHLALSSVVLNIYCKLTACDLQHFQRPKLLLGFDEPETVNCNVDNGVDKLSGEVNRQTIVAFHHPNEADLERGSQGRRGGEPRRPFLLRFPIIVYGITLGLGSHAVMWKNIASLSPMQSEDIPRVRGDIFWLLCLLHLLLISIIYSIKFVGWPMAVSEYLLRLLENVC